ncbi:MAG: hypothetical protein HC930_03990 [Hydrococcus sp. SU_1_0]|nr:hypothetical protein [Hydrococcus sp. SU_1_0]
MLVTPHLQNWAEHREKGFLHRKELLQVGKEKNVAVVDLMSFWESYLAKNNWQVDSLLRDSVHMNEFGRQLSARVIVDYFVRATQEG